MDPTILEEMIPGLIPGFDFQAHGGVWGSPATLNAAQKARRVGLLGRYLRELAETDAVKEKLLRGPLQGDLRDLGLSSQVGGFFSFGGLGFCLYCSRFGGLLSRRSA
jgi:hypothetical protein